MAGFITDAGATYLLSLFSSREAAVPRYYVALTRTVPAPYMGSEDLDEIGVAEYQRAEYINDGSAWDLSGNTVGNAIELSWPVATVDWGDAMGWALLDSPEGGRILYGGDLGTVWTISAGTQPVMTPGQLAVSLSVSDWALEI